MTSNLEKRVFQHANKILEDFSSKYGCSRLVYCESLDDVRAAIDREKVLKGWTREKKIALIESINPRWKDLSSNWGREFLMMNESMAEHDRNKASAKNLGAAEKH